MLLVELPVLSLQFEGGQVLLVCPLLVVEGEEQCLQVIVGEVFFPVEHGHGGERIVLLQRNRMSSFLHLLVVRSRDVSVRDFKHAHHPLVLFQIRRVHRWLLCFRLRNNTLNLTERIGSPEHGHGSRTPEHLVTLFFFVFLVGGLPLVCRLSCSSFLALGFFHRLYWYLGAGFHFDLELREVVP